MSNDRKPLLPVPVRDAAADLADCEKAGRDFSTSSFFVIVVCTALPHWIHRAVAAEAEIVRLRGIIDSLAARCAGQAEALDDDSYSEGEE